METPVRIAPRLTIQDPLAAVVLDCRPQVLPGAMDVSGTDLAEIRSMSRAGVATTVPPEREQSFGGGDWLSLICPELGVTPQIDPGTDLEDELSIPASPLAADEHGVLPLSVLVDVDSELEQVFGDVGSLSTMVTPVCDLEGGLRVTPAECPVIEPPGVSGVVTQPSMVYSPAGPIVHRGPGGWSLFPAVPLTPRPATASHHGGESDAVGGPSEVPDLSREGPFDIHQDHPRSVASPRLLQDTQGCPFRMTSYDEETSGPDLTPAYGVQLHDPRLLEYVSAPESARLTSRSPEHWVHHMSREKALSAALQLQHDAGLILSNVQVLQQLVTVLNRTSSDVLRAVHGRRPFPANAMQQVMPSCRVRRAAYCMMAMGLWHPPVATEIRGPLPLATCNACMSCSDCFPDVPM